MPTTKTTRRKFLSSAVRAGAALALPAAIPAAVLGKNGAVVPSEQILVGGIGIRGRGMGDLHWIMRNPDVRVLAICDLQKKQREIVKEVVNKQYDTQDCKMYPEIRAFLAERPDLDAVLIATGDRWHATASILAWWVRASSRPPAVPADTPTRSPSPPTCCTRFPMGYRSMPLSHSSLMAAPRWG